MTANQFVKHVRSEAAKHNVKVHLPKQSCVYIGELACGGYSSDTEIAVGIDKPQEIWFPILAHEYCHMMQTVEKAKVSLQADQPFYDRLDAITIFHDWIEGTDYPRYAVQKAYTRSRNIELDCEKRVAKLIQQLDLPIDIETHTRQSNAYIFFYDVARRHRVWPIPGRLYSNNTDLIQASPDKFLPTSHYSHVEDYPELYRQLILASERLF